ncbi:winged helix-turn-helix domain-containing protein [Streptomyces sp. NPDC057271]|uniref:winged helix-turn-helix domain-containing protein n=1 Tax=unclassified Streptomyces TaxID=2593676 RepID=UPI003637212E
MEAGPAAHGWSEDQRWTPREGRGADPPDVRPPVHPRRVSHLLHRLGWSPQVPVHRAVERDEQAVTRSRTEGWSRVRGRPSSSARGSASRAGLDAAGQFEGQGLGPGPDGRDGLRQTGPRNQADLPDPDVPGRTGENKGFRAREFADLLTSARQQLGGAPLIVVWDNVSSHHAKALRQFSSTTATG